MAREEISKKKCGCTSFMDDWNRIEESKCEECLMAEKKEWHDQSLRRAKKYNRCFECALEDRKIEHLGMRTYLERGICKRHEKLAHKIVLDKFGLKSFETEEILHSERVRLSYKNFSPGNKGFATAIFEKWALKMIREEENKAIKNILENTGFNDR